MLTIKHITPSGHEFATECVSYSVSTSSDALTSDSIQICGYDTPHMSGNCVFLVGGRRTSPAPDAESVFVMNSKGATVASHYFTPLLGAGTCGADVGAVNQRLAA